MAEYPATNNLSTFNPANPLGTEDAGKGHEVHRETRTVLKTFLKLIFADNGTLLDDIIATAQVLNNAITAAKLADDVAGLGLTRNGTSKAIDLLFDADFFELDNDGKLTIKSSADLGSLITALAGSKVDSLPTTKLSHTQPAARFLITQSDGTFSLSPISGAVSINGNGVASIVNSIGAFLLVETAPNGTSPGGLTADTWTSRTLSGEQFDTNNSVSVNGAEFVLQPGTYVIDAKVPAYRVAGHQAKLQSYDGTNWVDERIGTSSFSDDTSGENCTSEIFDIVTITDETRFRIQSKGMTTNATNGRGLPASAGEQETFTRILGYLISSNE